MPITHALGLLILVGGIILIVAVAKRIKRAPLRPSSADADEAAALHAAIGRMEERIVVLERILDAEDSDWRKRL